MNGLVTKEIRRVGKEGSTIVQDHLAEEAPVEIRVIYGPQENRSTKSISITMRTSGSDNYLAVGFLFTEGILGSAVDIEKLEQNPLDPGIIEVHFAESFEFDSSSLDRNFYTTSSCGVCGKSSIDSIKSVSQFKLDPNGPKLKTGLMSSYLEQIRNHQGLFALTGGIHAAFLFDKEGHLVDHQEDVGRHNALDKLVGKALLSEKLPLSKFVLLLSGRASFELIQKAIMAGLPIVVSIGAPSSLAVELAKENDVTLIGFLKKDSFNIYNDPGRLILEHHE